MSCDNRLVLYKRLPRYLRNHISYMYVSVISNKLITGDLSRIILIKAEESAFDLLFTVSIFTFNI